ncbi:hypothetical protein BDY21DRAFT_343790 [Lineolata rhizophorae]|uniref:Uncharacterized protein n=1 Tax=Lineolata rhizophorae TaxID=578093 RepID=A0A6A6P098_9PEZI|nr:hypothetical protein BDY21DRAFT_343790 [Lineolata rhizophorae]
MLLPRDIVCEEDQFGNPTRCYRTYSAWDDWARWVVLAVIIVGFFLLFVLCS